MSGDENLAQRRLTRRRATRPGGLAMAAVLGTTTLDRVAAQEADLDFEPNQDGLSADVIDVFSTLPGTKGLKLWAPPDAGRPAWAASLNPDHKLFIASSFKSFVLAEYLLQAEEALDPAGALLAAQLTAQLAEELPLDEAVFSPGSRVFNAPKLRGTVTARTVMEAMIAQSDNTATDMALRRTGPERVRRLIASLGLANTQIPDGTRQFNGWVFGDPEWQTITWPRLVTLRDSDPYPHRPLLNDEITMASTPDDLVDFYTDAFQGRLFRYPETLAVFRAFLSQANTIALSMPLGINAFVKSGWAGTQPNSPEVEGALSIAGAAFVRSRWVYFSLVTNWPAAAGTLPEVESRFFAATNAIFSMVRDRLEP